MSTSTIWKSRLRKELKNVPDKLPKGVKLDDKFLDEGKGTCRCVFSFDLSITPAATASSLLSDEHADGGEEDEKEKRGEEEEEEKKKGGEAKTSTLSSDADAATAESKVRFTLEFIFDEVLTKYPFEAPVITLLKGREGLPPSFLASSDGVVQLPDTEQWTPSHTLLSTLESIVLIVTNHVTHLKRGAGGQGLGVGLGLQGGGDEEGEGVKGLQTPIVAGEAVHIERIQGGVFPCKVNKGRFTKASSRYLAVTSSQLMELEAHKSRNNHVVVVACYPLASLAKLRFKRGESVAIVCKDGSTRSFLMSQAHECVLSIQSYLGEQGIATALPHSGAAQCKVDEARAIMLSIDKRERLFRNEPSRQGVEQCMDLFRQAAELFEAGGDDRHTQVLQRMHQFLQREDVLALLDGKPLPPAPPLSEDMHDEVVQQGGEPPQTPQTGEEDAVAVPVMVEEQRQGQAYGQAAERGVLGGAFSGLAAAFAPMTSSSKPPAASAARRGSVEEDKEGVEEEQEKREQKERKEQEPKQESGRSGRLAGLAAAVGDSRMVQAMRGVAKPVPPPADVEAEVAAAVEKEEELAAIAAALAAEEEEEEEEQLTAITAVAAAEEEEAEARETEEAIAAVAEKEKVEEQEAGEEDAMDGEGEAGMGTAVVEGLAAQGEGEVEVETEQGTEAEKETETETETGAEKDAGTETGAETEKGTETETETEQGPEAEEETETGGEKEAGTETGVETEKGTETETETEQGPEAEEETVAEADMETEGGKDAGSGDTHTPDTDTAAEAEAEAPSQARAGAGEEAVAGEEQGGKKKNNRKNNRKKRGGR